MIGGVGLELKVETCHTIPGFKRIGIVIVGYQGLCVILTGHSTMIGTLSTPHLLTSRNPYESIGAVIIVTGTYGDLTAALVTCEGGWIASCRDIYLAHFVHTGGDNVVAIGSAGIRAIWSNNTIGTDREIEIVIIHTIPSHECVAIVIVSYHCDRE